MGSLLNDILANLRDLRNVIVGGNTTVRPLGNPLAFPTILQHLNPSYGDEMAQDGAFTGGAELMYAEDEGTVGGEWDATNIVGSNFVFDSTLQNHTPDGQYSIQATTVEDGDTMQLDNGPCPTCVAITGWIKITKWSEVKENHLALFVWDTVGGEAVGSEVRIEDFVNSGTLDVWQKFVIPFSEMSVSGNQVDAFRLRVDAIIGEPNAPDFFLDDIQLQESGAPLIYTATPIPGTWYHAKFLKTVLTGVPDAFFADGFTPQLTPSKFFNIDGLTNGVVQLISLNGSIIQAMNIKTTGEFETIPEMEGPRWWGDGTTVRVTFKTIFSRELILKSETNDSSSILISEDLTGVGSVKASFGGSSEIRTT